MPQTRIRYLDYCKGLAIILVVAGHYFPAESPASWIAIREIIYTFHMPTFFFVSGYFFFGEMEKPGFSVAAAIRKKASRLLVPFAAIAVVFLLIKIAASLFVTLEHGLTARAAWNAVLDPVHSYVPLLWFMQALFIMCALFLLLRAACGIPATAIFAVFVVLSFARPPAYFSIDHVFAHMRFFCFGYLARQYSLPEKISLALGSAVLLLFAANAVFLAANPGAVFAERLSGYLGIVSVLFLSLLLSRTGNRVSALVEKAGVFSMGIYLLHPFFESAVRVAYYQLFKFPPAWFWLGFVGGVLAGVIPGALIEAHALRRYRVTRRLFLGLSR